MNELKIEIAKRSRLRKLHSMLNANAEDKGKILNEIAKIERMIETNKWEI